MDKKRSDSNLIVDVRIHFQGKVLKFSFGRVIRWLVPVGLIAFRLIAHLRNSPT